MLQETLAYEVLSVVEEIPAGKVATYGQIARLIGRPRNARLVGRILRGAEQYGSYPCHRVVNHAGRLAPGLAGAGGPARGGGGLPEPERLCGFGPGPVGLLTEVQRKGGAPWQSARFFGSILGTAAFGRARRPD